MTLPAPRFLVFDWDNTLIDSWECLRAAINATFRQFGLPEWSLDQTKASVALSLRDSFPKLFGDRWEEAKGVYYAHFERTHLQRLQPLPGVEPMLEGLATLGLPMAVVSNKTGRFLRSEAEHLGWARYFRHLVGANDAPRDKPAPDPVRMAVAGGGVDLNAAVWLIGDSPVDMECAQNAGATPILLRAEGPSQGEFALHPPARHVLTCEDFLALVRSLV
jgi:phosphoglycolate phosphatase